MLTRTEHIHIYKYRGKILCNEEDIKLLLYSYLTETRPTFYWLRSQSRETILRWIRPLLKQGDQPVDETLRRNTYRFASILGEKLDLSTVLKNFSNYRYKSEMRDLIVESARSTDIPQLVKLIRSRNPDVASASRAALLGLVSMSNEDVLDSISKTPSQRLFFEDLSVKLSEGIAISKIYELFTAAEKWKRLLAIHALGRNGSRRDLVQMQQILDLRTTKGVLRLALAKSVLRLAMKLRAENLIKELRVSEDSHMQQAYSEIFEDSLSEDFLQKIQEEGIYIDSTIASKLRYSSFNKKLPLLKKILKDVRIGYRAGHDLILAICELGSEREFDFLLKFFLQTEQELMFENAAEILDGVSVLARPKHRRLLNSMVKSNEFWLREVKSDQSSAMAVSNPYNEYFLRWVVGVAYAKLATRQQLNQLRQLLKHPYWTVRNSAATAILRVAKPSDFPTLIEDAIAIKINGDAILRILCELDRRFYPLGTE
jgi:hypothetical protein